MPHTAGERPPAAILQLVSAAGPDDLVLALMSGGGLYLKRAKADQIAFGTAGTHRALLAHLVDIPGPR